MADHSQDEDEQIFFSCQVPEKALEIKELRAL